MSDGVRLIPHGHVLELRLDRPESGNAMSLAFAGAVGDAAADITARREVRAVVVSSSSPRAFCVGADLKERAALAPDEVIRRRPLVRRAYNGVLGLPMPVVAAVTGYALGGGCELALACDLIVADDSAVFGLPEVTLGLIPGGGGTQLLARRTGYARAADLIFTGRRIGAEEAERFGMVDRRVAAGAREAALELAGQIAENSPVGVRNAKAALRAGQEDALATGLAAEDAHWRIAVTAGDQRAGIAAFLAKQRPEWPGICGSYADHL